MTRKQRVSMHNIVVIPARGGSKGIPRKNLRPVAGKPLIFHSINCALKCPEIHKVIVSTDDDEIALFSKRFGADVQIRPPELADDKTTLDPVIEYAVNEYEKENKCSVDYVVTIQPTSPLVLPTDITRAIEIFRENNCDTVMSVVDDRHLTWGIDERGKARPNYTARVNRQSLPQCFRETGAIIACKRDQLKNGSRIGEQVELLEMPQNRSFDIDNFSDLYLCESILNRKTICFVVTGHEEVGLGHAYRTILLANELVNFNIEFLCNEIDDLAIEFISNRNYQVTTFNKTNFEKKIKEISPDLIINDILDTESSYISQLRSFAPKAKVINFEDFGSGSFDADLTINALYPQQEEKANILTGTDYFCLRDEFLFIEKAKVNTRIQKIVLTFGGVDEGNLTLRSLQSIEPLIKEQDLSVTIVTGPGYKHKKELNKYLHSFSLADKVDVIHSTNSISDIFIESDIAITSGGRTVLELASLEVPTVAICQNQRETTHHFAHIDNGIVNLGHRGQVKDEDILETVSKLIIDQEYRNSLVEKMKAIDLQSGKKRVVSLIKELIPNS
jgi:CMP-N-acetylneuraminic acid synthetase/spore coat polysaccharide biosynthesis predicted glycosyltransferase SpsG